jgi:hypothetical protein
VAKDMNKVKMETRESVQADNPMVQDDEVAPTIAPESIPGPSDEGEQEKSYPEMFKILGSDYCTVRVIPRCMSF